MKDEIHRSYLIYCFKSMAEKLGTISMLQYQSYFVSLT